LKTDKILNDYLDQTLETEKKRFFGFGFGFKTDYKTETEKHEKTDIHNRNQNRKHEKTEIRNRNQNRKPIISVFLKFSIMRFLFILIKI
jgi:hypothetical protein